MASTNQGFGTNISMDSVHFYDSEMLVILEEKEEQSVPVSYMTTGGVLGLHRVYASPTVVGSDA